MQKQNYSTDSKIQQNQRSGLKNSPHNTQSNIKKLKGKKTRHANLNQDTASRSGIRASAIHEKIPSDIARHDRKVKHENDYTKGAQDELGQDSRRSRRKATQFQEDLVDE